MHLYAFGSICRGDIDRLSDIDLLAIIELFDERLDPSKFSIYSYNRIKKLWDDGNPFAWHLHSESKLLFSENDQDFLCSLGEPQRYVDALIDCAKFQSLFEDSVEALSSGSPSQIFEFSSIFLAVRNVATCFALGKLEIKEFSRFSALNLNEYSLEIDQVTFGILQKCRLLSTRGVGELPVISEFAKVMEAIPVIRDWMKKIMEELQ